MVAWRGAKVSGEPNRRGSGSNPAVISALGLGLLHLSQPTLAVRIGTAGSCQIRYLNVTSRGSGSQAFTAMFFVPSADSIYPGQSVSGQVLGPMVLVLKLNRTFQC
jgi:hypothetical protein